MDDDEVRLAQAWIVESRFEQQRIASTLTIVPTRAFDAVNMNREPEPSRFAANVIEKKILQRFVIVGAGFTTSDKSRIGHPRAAFVRIIKVELAEICCFKLDRDRAVALLSLQCGRYNSGQVLVQSQRHGINLQITKVSF